MARKKRGKKSPMTEAAWLAGTGVHELVQFLEGKVSDRKLRLFACACCRTVQEFMVDPETKTALQAAERLAEGQLSPVEQTVILQAADRRAQSLQGIYICGGGNVTGSNFAAMAAAAALAANLRFEYTDGGEEDRQIWTPWASASRVMAQRAREHVKDTFPPDENEENPSQDWWDRLDKQADDAWADAGLAAVAAQCDLLRDIVGNPFRPVVIDPKWLRWEDGTVVKLARAIEQENAFERMGILADALEEAGCTDGDILSHCRTPQQHVRGCWLVEVILGLV